MDGLEGNFTRPRQVRYQAALRPDMRCSIDSELGRVHTTRRVSTIRAKERKARKRDSLVRKYLIPHKLLIFQLARLAQLAAKRQFWQL